MTDFYVKSVRFLIRHKFIYAAALILFFSCLAWQLSGASFDVSDTLWLSSGELNEESSSRDFTVLAFDIGEDVPPAAVTSEVISALGGVRGVSRVANGRLIAGLSGRLNPRTGVVTFQLDAAGAGEDFGEEVRKRLADVEGIGRYHYIGQSILQAELVKFTQKDTGRLLPLVFIVSFGILLVLYRNVFVASLPVLNIILTFTGASGVYVLLGFPVTVTASIFPALVMVLCLNDSIYILNALIRGEDEFRKILLPCLQTGAGLVIGFAALMFSNYRPVVYLGIIGIAAVVFSLFTALYVLPVIHFLYGRRDPNQIDWISPGWWRSLYTALSMQRRLLVFLLAVVSVTMLFFSLRLRIGADALEYFRSPNTLTRSLDYFLKQGLPVDRISVYISPPEGEKIEPKAVREWLQTLKQGKKVCGTLSMIDFQFAGFFPIGVMPPSYLTELGSKYSEGPSGRIRIDLFEQFTSTEDVRDFLDWFDSWFRAYSDKGFSREFRGGAYFSWQLESRHAESQLRGFVFSAALIFGLLFILFGPRVGVIASIENCWPILATVSLVTVLGIRFNFVTVMIANLVIGLAVEDTLYLLNRYRSLRNAGADPSLAFSGSAESLGNSSVFSSVIMAAGFVLLLFSEFTPTFQLGLMATFAIFAALFADLIILPLLLQIYDRTIPGRNRRAV